MSLIVLFCICRITGSISAVKGEKTVLVILSESSVTANVLKITRQLTISKAVTERIFI